MNAPVKQSQASVLFRLYDLKQKQLMQAAKQSDSLRYKVLAAEADAISDAIKALR